LVYIDLERYDEALNDFNHALEVGDIPAAYSGRGTTYYWLGRYDEAIVDLELARDMLPYRPTSYCYLALSYFEVGRYQDSLDTATKLYQISPGCGGQRVLEIQARDYYALGDYEQAIFYINQALEQQEYVMGYYYRGTMYQAMGNNEEAISDFETFLSLVHQTEVFQVEIADAEARLEKLKK
jgi:tetratricopeptide (TPR) repeat protein